MGHQETIEKLKSICGGNITNHVTRKGTIRMHRWTVDRSAAATFLLCVFPFLISKRSEAEIALDYRSWQESRFPSNAPYSDSDNARCTEFSLRLKASRCTMVGHRLRAELEEKK